MKKTVLMMSIAALVIVVGVQIAAAAPGGFRGFASLQPQQGVWNPELTQEQRAKLLEIHEQYYKELNKIRAQLIDKTYELKKLYLSENPDKNKINALYDEVSALRAKFYNIKLQQRDAVAEIMGVEQYLLRGYGFGYGGPGFGRMGFRGCWGY
jgi:Spy/CpxP family protein refolding chaperone